MIFTNPEPMADAMRRMSDRSPVGARLNSREWEEVPVALRERAIFSAGVESARVLKAMQNRLHGHATHLRAERASGKIGMMDREEWIVQMREIARAEGLHTLVDPALRGGIQDITSVPRLGLVFDMQTDHAAGFSRWKADQDPDLLDAFPAQELYRSESRREPRDWTDRWQAAGGTLYGGRMIALKSSEIWERISRFGTPFPPYDFGSGMWVRDVDRAEAERIGLIEPGERPTPSEAGFNDRLEASARGLDGDHIEWLRDEFGDRIQVKRGRVEWTNDVLDRMWDDALREAMPTGSADLGKPGGRAIDQANALGHDLSESRLVLTPSNVKHILERHGPPGIMGPGTGETQPGQLPVTRANIQMLSLVWRHPTQVSAGGRGRLRFEADFGATHVLVVYEIDAKNPQSHAWGVQTAWIRKEGPPATGMLPEGNPPG